jgi:thioredoxin 1
MKEIENGDQFVNILNKSECVVVDMFATWCGPCKRIVEPMNQLAEKYPHINFVKLDIDKMRFMDINLPEPDSIPTIVYMKRGENVKMLSTSNMNEIENALSVFN